MPSPQALKPRPEIKHVKNQVKISEPLGRINGQVLIIYINGDNGASSLDIEVFAYVTTTDQAEFLPIREDVLLRIMDILEQGGTGFFFPS